MVPANVVEKMYVHIALKKSKASFRYAITPEMAKLWDQITFEIKENSTAWRYLGYVFRNTRNRDT